MEPILTRFVREPHAYTIDSYLTRQGGYEGLRKALAMTPDRSSTPSSAPVCAGAAAPAFRRA